VPLIPAPPTTPDKDTLALRVDRELHDQLRAYAEFLGSTKEYIVTSALRRVFRHDKDFIAWQHARSSETATTVRRADAHTTPTSNGNKEAQATPTAETQRRPAGGR
jgi:predicted transcriptional regulator